MARQPAIDRQVPAGTAAVHALVVGVGHYDSPELPGLAGAAPSALAFAEWLATQHQRPGLSLGSVDVLTSQPSGARLRWRDAELDAPTRPRLQAAVDAWHERAKSNPGNLAVFYFCGHGIELGGLQSLMLEDVDLASADPFGNALAFDDFIRGMDSCGARQQLFVLDACRDLPPAFARLDDNVALGSGFVRLSLKERAKMTPRKHVVLQAAAATQKAWAGSTGGWFTDALLSVLDGAACNPRFRPNEYPVNTRDIADTIEFLVANQYLVGPAGQQTPVRRGDGDFDFHMPARPLVPVMVTRKPPASNLGERFEASAAGAVVASHDCVDAGPWRSKLGVGDYEFRRATDALTVKIDVPARTVELP